MPNLDHNLRILIVDDEVFIRRIVTHLLRDIGFSDLFEAADGGVALEQCRSHEPTLVICDINMNPVTGLEFLRAVRVGKAGIPRETPVIFLTVLSDQNTIGDAFALDVNAFLVKPISRSQLERKIDRVMSTKINIRDEAVYAGLALSKSPESRLPPSPTAPVVDPAAPVADPAAPAVEKSVGPDPAGPDPAEADLTLEDSTTGEVENERAQFTTRVVKKTVADMEAMGATRRRITELKPQSRLAENIMSAHGVLIIEKGDVLGKETIDKLYDIEIMFGKTEIWVIEP